MNERKQIPRDWWGIVVAGMMCSGKSEVGDAVARRFNFRFLDADTFHLPHARETMSKGIGVNDRYRRHWLNRVIGGMIGLKTIHLNTVIACSALRLRNRRQLLEHAHQTEGARLKIVWLDIPPEELRRRANARDREGRHFAKSSLLDSQIHSAQRPLANEPNTIIVPGVGTPGRQPADQIEEVAERVVEAVRPWLFVRT